MTVDLPPPPPYRMDPHTLGEIVDPDLFQRSIAALQRLLAGGGLDPDVELALRARLGGELRVLGRYDEALLVLRRAVILADRLGDTGRAHTARIRLAHAHQGRGEYATSTAMFERLLSGIDELPTDLVCFTLQHAGKNLFDQCRYAEAEQLFAEALRLREAIGAPPDQIESSRAALTETRRRREPL